MFLHLNLVCLWLVVTNVKCWGVEPCTYGLPRCPHCNGDSIAACDGNAVNLECQNEDVSSSDSQRL